MSNPARASVRSGPALRGQFLESRGVKKNGGALDRIAECLSQLSARLSDNRAVELEALQSNFGGALAELELLRSELSKRIAARDSRAESLNRIDAALGELNAVFTSLWVAAESEKSALPASSRRQAIWTPPRRASAQTALRRVMALIVGITTAGTGMVGLATRAAADATTPTYIGMTPEDIGVMERSRPAYDAKGIPLGAFRLFPALDVSATYDDNVFRAPVAQSDYYFTISPSVRVVSQWGRHYFEIYGGLNNYNYSSFSRLNLTDWKVGSDGRLDISRAATVSANVSYGEMHELLSSANTVGFQASPNRYNQTHAEVTAAYQPNRIGLGLGGSYDRFDFMNTPLIGGGFLINTDRNESEYQGYAKLFYDFSPGYSAFVKGLYDSRDFDQFFDRTGRHRSSHGYRVDTGLDLQISHLLAGQVYVGYLEQLFSQSVPLPLKNVSGLDYGVGLDWFATPILTVHLNGTKQISDTTLGGVSASEDSIIKLSADYEFRYNVLLQGYVSYTHSQLVGTTRTDDYPGAGVGVKYLMNRYLSADLNYAYGERSSNFAGVSYSDNSVSIALTAHL